jgi:hypothetical protein
MEEEKIDIHVGYKTVKRLLPTLDFHHTWGYWIFNKNSNYRIVVKPAKNTIGIFMTKIPQVYDYKDVIRFPKIGGDMEMVKERIKSYYNIKS